MPRRPPRKWFRSVVRGVASGGSAYDPESVAGALWYHKLSPAQKRRILRASEKGHNPVDKKAIVDHLHHDASAASAELNSRGMEQTATFARMTGKVLGAVALHTRGWQGSYADGMHVVVGGSRLRHTKVGRKRRRTPAQKRATEKMLRAARRARRARGTIRRKAPHHKMAARKGRKAHRTAAQKAATKKMIRAAARARRAKKGRRK
jgi:hypothetical protein